MERDISLSYDFERVGQTTIVGTCYWLKEDSGNGRPAELVEKKETIQGVHSVLSECTGMYTIITEVRKGICISTDVINAYPVCYYIGEKVCYISDNNKYILEKVKERTINETSYQEYKHATYVSGGNTLIEGVRQTEGGKTIAIGDGGEVSERREDIDFAGNISREPSDIADVAITSVERLAKYAAGRSIWLAMSGGYDSRILAVMLKRIGYSDINTYTYGLGGNIEVGKSKHTARKLGLNWEFVKHTPEIWQDLYDSSVRREMDDRHWIRTSLPIADWPAVHQLRRQEKMGENAVIVTGHGGGFLAGVIFPDKMYSEDYVRHSQVVDAIMRQNYNKNNISKNAKEKIKRRLSSNLNFDGGSGALAVSYLDRWNLSERQTKHVTSCLQTFEPYNVSYWLPYFDEEYVRFWSNTNTDQRINKKIYKEFINKCIDDREKIIGTKSQRQTKNESESEKKLKNIIINIGIKDVLVKFWNVWKHITGNVRQEYDGQYADPRGSLTAIDFGRFKKLYNGDAWLSSYRAREILGEISLTKQE